MERKTRRTPRKFTAEFKADTAKLVIDGHRTIAQLVKEFDLSESALGTRVRQARAHAPQGHTGTLDSEEKEELSRLRHENKVLRMEREILSSTFADFEGELEANEPAW